MRGRGIARSLLLHAFTETRARGGKACELSTDSRTGALTLYEHVGMRVKHSFVHWARSLEPSTTS
jgi:ribosomal protein S18 acetylase RimI-like enzyme